MVFLYKLLLTLGIILCSSFSILAYPRPVDEKPISSSFLDRSILHLPDHSHLSLNISDQSHPLPINVPRNHSLFHSKHHPLVGKLIPCTSDEKICFRHNMVFVPLLDKCRPVGDSGLCNITISRSTVKGVNGICDSENINLQIAGETKQLAPNESSELGTDIVVDEENKNMTNQNEVLRAENNGPECSGYILKNDGKCHSIDEVHDICGCDAEPTAHDLGRFECNCKDGASQIHVEQPRRDGLCQIPDFRYPHTSYSSSSSNIYSLLFNCSQEQRDCFSQNKIWMSETQKCFYPLERGPCPEEHVIALNASAGETGYAVGACVHERGGCPKGSKRLRLDQKCYTDRELDIREMYVELHPFGLYDAVSSWSPKILEEEQMCGFRRKPIPSQTTAATNVARPGWGVQNDRGEVFGGNVDSKATNPSSLE